MKNKGKVRLLIAEDDLESRQYLVELLKQHPQLFEIVGEAGTGFEALELCLCTKPDIIILDLHMPGEISGLSLLHLLKQKNIAVKTLVFTSDHTREKLVYEVGADKFLIKGVSTKLIIATLKDLAVQ
jgi:DNA-binding NarL/FixJ family response regulator